MKVIHFPLEVNYVNSFLCYDEDARDAFLVDCGAFEAQIEDFVQKNDFNLKMLLLTHSHYDHIDGVKDFKRWINVPIYASTKKYDHRISEGDTIAFADSEISVLATPGHTPDGVSFYLKPFVFVGDAIFAGAVGGTAGRKQFQEEAQHVWNKILALPDDTIIYPGHGAPSMVGVERLYNPFFD
ncbi:MBL fold metallo-hydrolase [candidate division KSB1 bacterium]|nr:MBL fold metallo-hydrolase [candidate division KSB1 bacterium]NIR71704.1 MBL fold metallo-hydrolase [candidate division KSB1 bacterium]NIS28251.1 MBL fold metallo-hydrolase [candidate division KSB1 bacterium]NIT70381.1 MBL fold metallo-hydrolase [candidate division KSB1 bacterium]NIU28928.1 MBL fold metallo-hydrolase [candidate division KSB1 bacterium]